VGYRLLGGTHVLPLRSAMFLRWLQRVHDATRLLIAWLPPWLSGRMWSTSWAVLPQYWQVLLSRRRMYWRVRCQPGGFLVLRVEFCQAGCLCCSQYVAPVTISGQAVLAQMRAARAMG